jgi:two-component system KDP operon response regulator KdpE
VFPECFHVLVAAQDDGLRHTLCHSLGAAGFYLEQVNSERQAIEVVKNRRFDLVLLRLSSTEAEGIETCRDLRATSPQLRIVMVRVNGSPEDEGRALDAGADDCIAVPLKFRETIARLNATLRRGRVKRGPKAKIFRAGKLEVDPALRLVRKAGREAILSSREFDLLLHFIKNQEVPLTHTKLLRAVWGGDSGENTETLRLCIKGLRKKIESDPANPEYIVTEPWVGYRFHDPGLQSRN